MLKEVISKKMAYIKPEINGAIRKVHIEEGEYVDKRATSFYYCNRFV